MIKQNNTDTLLHVGQVATPGRMGEWNSSVM